jgi:cyclic pyranopterin phosphate synthase
MSRVYPDSLPADASPALQDQLGRPLRSLRISVTDRCNLRCQYCMPEEEYVWLQRTAILTFEELIKLTYVFTELGVNKVRLTGGEPLLRKDLHVLVRMLRQVPGLTEVALTTNGVLLAEQAEALYTAGLHRLTVSLDTLQTERFKALARRDSLARVLTGLQVASQTGFEGLKLDTVIIRNFNDDELVDLLEFGKRMRAEVRFIEYMDVGGATHWALDKVFSRQDILQRLQQHYGTIEPLAGRGSAPAERFRLPDGTTFGIIASTTTPFCSACDRSRLTADGMWLLCLYATQGIDLREPLRLGASPATIKSLLRETWQGRDARGAEKRKELEQFGTRGTLVQLQRLRQEPHLEMHTRGG